MISRALPLVLLALFSLAACRTGPARRPGEARPPVAKPLAPARPRLRAAIEPPRFVLVRDDARLHRFSHAGAEIGHEETTPHPHPPGAVSVYRLVADHGAWLELESLPGWAGLDHCHDADPRMVGLALRVFVHRRDIAAVSLTPVIQHYPDGTSLRLAAGASLSAPLAFEAPTGEHIRHLQAGGLALNAEIPDASVGTDYAPSPLPEAHAAQGSLETIEIPRGTVLRFGLGAKVRIDATRSARVLGTASGQRRVNLGSSCLELVALLGAEESPVAAPPPRRPPMGTSPGKGPVASILPGTHLYWPGGRPAGVAVHMAGFEKIALEEPERICLLRSVPFFRGGSAEGKRPGNLVVCVPPTAVVDADQAPRD